MLYLNDLSTKDYRVSLLKFRKFQTQSISLDSPSLIMIQRYTQSSVGQSFFLSESLYKTSILYIYTRFNLFRLLRDPDVQKLFEQTFFTNPTVTFQIYFQGTILSHNFFKIPSVNSLIEYLAHIVLIGTLRRPIGSSLVD